MVNRRLANEVIGTNVTLDQSYVQWSIKKIRVTKGEADALFGRGVQVLQEMMESEHAGHRLQAAEIVLGHAKKRRFWLSS